MGSGMLTTDCAFHRLSVSYFLIRVCNWRDRNSTRYHDGDQIDAIHTVPRRILRIRVEGFTSFTVLFWVNYNLIASNKNGNNARLSYRWFP